MHTVTAPTQPSRRRRAIALVLVLMLMALLMILMLGIMGMGRTEKQSSLLSAHTGQTRTLAETSINLVLSQIRRATADLGATETWASQPGMLRRYPSSSDMPKPSKVFKLYSAPRMVEDATFDPDLELPPADWNSRLAHFTDLNEPVFHDRAANGSLIPQFPIIDPRGLGEVDGFDYETTMTGAVKSGDSAQFRIPMPVRWLYVLRDGTMGTLSDQGKFTGEKPATKDNPITGRIAFWTDDESCKVNLNTASEGVYWSPPYGYTITERSKSTEGSDWVTGMPLPPYGYATSIPLRNEFQRMPGHPAATSLSSVLGQWLPVKDYPSGGETIFAFNTRFSSELASYYKALPRLEDGGSRGGTVWTGLGDNVKQMKMDTQRLFSTMDELLFAPDRTLTDTRLPPDAIQQSRFFLTTQSRAPEVTLSNKPRFALWPIMRESKYRSSLETLIAKCAEIGGRPYYWQRYSPWNSWSDPGSAQILNQEYDQVPRNRDLYSMLLRRMRAPLPGFSHTSFADKYGNDHAQILTSMVDFVRSSVSTVPNGLPPRYWYSAARHHGLSSNAAAPGEGSVVPLQIDVDGVETRGYGRFVTVTEGALVLHAARDPAKPTELPAAGQAKHVRAVFLLEPFSPAIGLPSWGPNVRYIVKGLDQFAINGQQLQFRSTIPIVGEIPIGYYDGLAHDNVAFIGFYQLFRRYEFGVNDPRNIPRTLGSDERNNYTLYGEATIPIPADATSLSFNGGPITIEIRSAHEAAPGRLLQTISMNFPAANAWPIPRVGSGTDPFTTNGALPLYTDFNERMKGAGNLWNYKMRIIQKGDVVKAVEARADAPLGGDLRLIYGLKTVPADLFKPHERYQSSDYSTGRFAHGLRNDRHTYQGQIGWRNSAPGDRNPPDDRPISSEGPPKSQDYIMGPFWTGWDWMPSTWSTAGAILPGRVHFRDHAPAVARGLNGAYRADGRLGDWETGHGITPDGCYIRKAHEGNVVSGRGDGGYFMQLQGDEGGNWGANRDDQANFYPNRQIASAIQFGAMPSGVHARRPFETLLFSPNPNGRTTKSLDTPTASDHRGFGSPRDHLLLDLFWMPVVEPYAVSEPFSTSGKINLNYEIMPHRYVKRRTGLHALMDKLRVTAIPSAALQDFQGSWSYKQSAPCRGEFRYDINMDPVTGTPRGFEERFKKGDIFRSASEICDLFLVPKRRVLPLENYSSWYPVADPSYETVTNWWSNFQLTGDNAREDPYNHLYPRVTTKSNVYRIHYRVQSLTKARSTDPDTWVEGVDRTNADLRGSALIERYIEPNDPNLPDFATEPEASVDDWYQFRVISQRRID